MIGLDTSVVIRLLTEDIPHLVAIAKTRILEAHAQGERLVVSDLVVHESYFALQQYGIAKDQARELLERMLTSGSIHLEPATSLPALAAATGAGLVDRLIVERYRALGASVWTFDQKQGSLIGVTRLA